MKRSRKLAINLEKIGKTIREGGSAEYHTNQSVEVVPSSADDFKGVESNAMR
jgi:hypothetical protein